MCVASSDEASLDEPAVKAVRPREAGTERSDAP